ncbi:hypothetical protein F4679DRAFT_587056 [Xylaria curta]|nr:hypothetical protein F4679DRAFT_587056 [Xylaria curta]
MAHPESDSRKSTKLQKRKWQQADDLLRDHQPSKKVKSSHQNQRQPSNFPPEVYDRFPKIWLTRRVLRELDRRNCDRFPRPLAAQKQPIKKVAQAVRKPSLGLSRFARRGGPNLCDPRGVLLFYCFLNILLSSTNEPLQCLDPTDATWTMASSSTPVPRSRPTAKSGRASAYDANFFQVCRDHCIYSCKYKFLDSSRAPEPANLDEIRQALKSGEFPLPSEGDHTRYEESNYFMAEATVMRAVIPFLTPVIPGAPNNGDTLFNNLTSLTRNETVTPKPDHYEGVHPDTVDKTIRDKLFNIIVPTKSSSIMVPNFFLEAKDPTGTKMVSDGQAMLDGAHGARLMHALQNYDIANPVYDDKAYTFSATLVDDILRLYAHHVATAAPGEQPHYYISLIDTHNLINQESYSQAVRALGNLWVQARDFRDHFIKVANARARGATDPEQDEDEEEEEETVYNPPGVVDDAAASFTTFVLDDQYDQRRPKPPRSPPSPSSPQSKKRGRKSQVIDF